VGVSPFLLQATHSANEHHHDLMADEMEAAAGAAAGAGGEVVAVRDDGMGMRVEVAALALATAGAGHAEAVFVFTGVGYKPGIRVPMIDASPSLAVAVRLAQRGRRVRIVDRKAIVHAVMKEHGALFEYEVLSNL
jgi:hypothetical protein